jgi:carbon-monoxide dehydrogenase small subunit
MTLDQADHRPEPPGVRVAIGGAIQVSYTINGEPVTVETEVRRSLSDVIRTELGLTGTHLGCEHGVCGACTVLFDGQPVRSCLVLAAQADGADLVTIEGLDDDGRFHPVQQAMHDRHGFQCAFCAPGFLLTTVALLERNPNPTEGEIREELSGNLCRCTGYQSIVDGVLRAVELLTPAKAGADSNPETESGDDT